MDKLIEHWSHTINRETGKVRINIPIDKDNRISIEVSEIDLKRMQQWFDLEKVY